MKHADHITIDDFIRLTPADHAVAIHTYSQRLTQLENRLDALPSQEEARELLLDEVRRGQQLRKVHVQALAEQLAILPQKAAA